MQETDPRTVIENAIKRALNLEGEDRWGVAAYHMSMSDWNSPSRRCNAVGEMVLRGFYLMHSTGAAINGRAVMWLHFAYEK